MKIVGTMLSGNNEAIVAEAIESIRNWVDIVLLVDTGISDSTIEIAKDKAGDKLKVVKFEWCNDFAKARNFALAAATEAGGDWALTIDTDERMIFDNCRDIEDLKAKLDQPKILMWLVKTRELNYSKERFTRLPTKLDWRGRTHEALCGTNTLQQDTLKCCRFWELPKTEKQATHKYERDLRILLEETEVKPTNARWWYYLGQTYLGLKLYRKSADAYRECYSLNDWREQGAWACYCCANALLKLNAYEEALETSAKGLTIHSGYPELAWQAGFCCFKLERYHHAISWQRMAIALGHFQGSGAGANRIGQRHMPGWYEAPFDVMRFSYHKIGDVENKELCDKLHEEAKQVRLTLQSVGASNGSKLSSTTKQRIVIVSPYTAGASAVAGILAKLEVGLGGDAWDHYHESKSLSNHLRQWWNKPDLSETNSFADRESVLRDWILQVENGGAKSNAAKHPLLSLCCPEIKAAWGADTKFIRVCRPLEASIQSLKRRKWWPGHESSIQSTLWESAESFFGDAEHISISFEDVLRSPADAVSKLVAHLGLKPSKRQIKAAIETIRPKLIEHKV